MQFDNVIIFALLDAARRNFSIGCRFRPPVTLKPVHYALTVVPAAGSMMIFGGDEDGWKRACQNRVSG